MYYIDSHQCISSKHSSSWCKSLTPEFLVSWLNIVITLHYNYIFLLLFFATRRTFVISLSVRFGQTN